MKETTKCVERSDSTREQTDTLYIVHNTTEYKNTHFLSLFYEHTRIKKKHTHTTEINMIEDNIWDHRVIESELFSNAYTCYNTPPLSLNKSP